MIENFETEKIREFDKNSKAVQISPILLGKCTQIRLGFGNDMATQTEDKHKEKVDTGTQHNFENHDVQLLTKKATLETESGTTSEDLDSSFDMSSQSESELFENEDDADNYCNSRIKAPSAIVVYWSSLLLLLQSCVTCSANSTTEKLTRRGSAILVHLKCVRGHINLRRSQPLVRSYYQGNIRMAAGVLFSSNTFEKMKKYFELAAFRFIS